MTKQIKNADGELLKVEVIRYFVNNDIEYLIYSLNEIDNNGYTKLYASKIIDGKACIISDDDEWKIIKEIIKEIIRCNRDGNKLTVIDLDENKLEEVELQDTRIFKLQGNLVNLLSDNKNFVVMIPNEEPPFSETPEHPEFIKEEVINENYEEMYKKEVERNKLLTEEIEQLKNKNFSYEQLIAKIREIVE